QDLVAALDHLGAQPSQGMELGEVGEVLVEDGEVDVEDLVGGGGDTVVEVALQVEDHRDAVLRERLPRLDPGGEEEPAVVVEQNDVHPYIDSMGAGPTPCLWYGSRSMPPS